MAGVQAAIAAWDGGAVGQDWGPCRLAVPTLSAPNTYPGSPRGGFGSRLRPSFPALMSAVFLAHSAAKRRTEEMEGGCAKPQTSEERDEDEKVQPRLRAPPRLGCLKLFLLMFSFPAAGCWLTVQH